MGIDMEGYAIFCSADNSPRPKPVPICIKSVVDFGNAQKSDDFQAFGCYVSAAICWDLIRRVFAE